MFDLRLVNVVDSNSFGDGVMDIDIDSIGDIESISSGELLVQNVLKNILTESRDDGYGSTIYNALGNKNESVVNKAYMNFVIIDSLLHLRQSQINEYLSRGVSISEIKSSTEILDKGLRILVFDSEPNNMSVQVLLSFSSNNGNITESHFTLSKS